MCSPCNHQCQQGRTCPARAQQHQAQPLGGVRRELGDALERIRDRYRRLRHAATTH